MIHSRIGGLFCALPIITILSHFTCIMNKFNWIIVAVQMYCSVPFYHQEVLVLILLSVGSLIIMLSGIWLLNTYTLLLFIFTLVCCRRRLVVFFFVYSFDIAIANSLQYELLYLLSLHHFMVKACIILINIVAYFFHMLIYFSWFYALGKICSCVVVLALQTVLGKSLCEYMLGHNWMLCWW